MHIVVFFLRHSAIAHLIDCTKYKHNFYMPQETKKFMWLALFWNLLYCGVLQLKT